MRISDSERRKVAARMREIMRKNPHMWFDVMVANAIRDVIGEGVVIGETVADLIDRPTWPRLLPQLSSDMPERVREWSDRIRKLAAKEDE